MVACLSHKRKLAAIVVPKTEVSRTATPGSSSQQIGVDFLSRNHPLLPPGIVWEHTRTSAIVWISLMADRSDSIEGVPWSVPEFTGAAVRTQLY